ncbi:magnesium transporter [Candidatus Peregrinibacteria bacterium]|nr:magnesium transporter [Candidatus Peregrinibacteria bacterium]
MKLRSKPPNSEVSGYPTSTAGRLMTTRIPMIHPTTTIRDVEQLLEQNTDAFETINYVYVVEKNSVLIGILSIKEVFRQPSEIKVADLLNQKRQELVTVFPSTDQERVASKAIVHELKAIPVVDSGGKLLGVVDSDSIFHILHEEHVEDLLKMGGVRDIEAYTAKGYFGAGLKQSIKSRLPWLILGLGGGIIAAQIVQGFEKALEAKLILAAFIPLVVYMADAIGTQTETLLVRNLALDPKMKLLKFLLREMEIGIAVALVCGGLISLYSFFRFHSPYLGMVLGPSLFVATFIAIFVGTLVPWFLFKLGQDPALGTGPLTTILQDIASVASYFVIASFMMRWLPV